MTTITEKTHAGAFLLSDGRPGARKQSVLLSGQNLEAGSVVGQITKVQAAAPIPTIAGTGTGAMTLLTFGDYVQTGNYVITLLATSATAAFSVVAPDGKALANGAVGTAYTSEHLSFLISSAGTMTVGDSYTVVVTAGGTPVLIGTGTGAVSAFSLGPDVQNGCYRVQLLATSGTAEFEVISPDGSKLRRGQVATAYTSSHINFTLSNAGTMTSGDYFNFIVAAGSGKWAQWAPTTYDGRHKAGGVLYSTTDASAGDTACVVVTADHDLSINELNWPTVTEGVKAIGLAQLAALGLNAR